MTNHATSTLSRLRESDRFLYRSVSRKLRHRVDCGEYQPGTRIPSVGELAKEFGVSTITVRRAIRDLSLEGHLIGRQGLGVFVASKQRIIRSLRADHIAPIEEDMRRSGVNPGIQELEMTFAHSDSDAMFEARNPSVHFAYRLERILLADNEPVALDTIWLPRKLGDLLKPKLRGQFVMSLIQAHQIELDHIDYQFEGSTASEEQGSFLNVMTGFPLLVIRYTPIGKNGVPLLMGRTTSRADRFVYRFCARPRAHRARRGR
jgi:GntR family transcriptional regulator